MAGGGGGGGSNNGERKEKDQPFLILAGGSWGEEIKGRRILKNAAMA